MKFKNAEIEVTEVVIQKKEDSAHINIKWSGDIGFGNYDIYLDLDKDNVVTKAEATSECMDSNDCKDFLKGLCDDIIKKIDIIE